MLKYVCVRAGTVADFDLRVMDITLSSHLICYIKDLQRLFKKVLLKFYLKIGPYSLEMTGWVRPQLNKWPTVKP